MSSFAALDPKDFADRTDGVTADGRLPVASPATVRRAVIDITRRHRGQFALATTLTGLAAVAGAIAPQLLGQMVEEVQSASSAGGASAASEQSTLERLDQLVLLLLAALIVQTGLVRWARVRASIMAEQVLAELRENFLKRVVGLPLSTVERAGTGDLVTRTTHDVDMLSWTVRMAIPEMFVGFIMLIVLSVALTLTAPILAVVPLVFVPIVLISTRWYRKRAPQVYREELAAFAQINAALAETVDAGRTIEAYQLAEIRRDTFHGRLQKWLTWEREGLRLRMWWFPTIEITEVLIVAGMLGFGGILYINDQATLAQVTTSVIYAQQLVEPIELLLMWYDDLQLGGAALARLLGVGDVVGPITHDDEPSDISVHAEDVRYAYREGHDVLHGVDLDVSPGSRVAIVGPSGAGKSTLGRLLAGIHPPRTGVVDMGGVPLAGLPPERLRTHVALVTQEHHVFVGSLRDNLLLAKPSADDEDLMLALDAVDARDWAHRMGLDTQVGSGAVALSPAQAQQIALARLVLADPHTLVLDEATSLLDPRAARHLESSLARVLAGRTVVAVAHRLQTAHDADVVAVVEDGLISEYGRHHDLVEANGPYAALWRSWHGD